MTTPFVCVLIAFILIFVPKLPLSMAMAKQPGGYDNKSPRAQQDALDGFGQRARGAHYNGFEAFGGFAAAVIIAHIAGANDHRSAVLAIAFVVARGLYIAAYLANQDYLRSALWGIGFLSTIALFCLPWLT
ncbi:MAG: MAPEG family protein [Deltaproteobacteria bacterium]|nr:MAPEG family protein [Deltaproteobacteria bacterium]